MKINEAVEITKGNLLTSPSIASFSRIILDINHIQKGDLFLAFNPEEIPLAIESGAYGIISCSSQPLDQEIAWIVVQDMSDCLTRLIRYKLLAKNITLVSLSPIEEAIAKEIIIDHKVAFFDGDLRAFLEFLNQDQLTFIVVHHQDILDLSFEVLNAHKPKNRPFLILTHNLFDATIFYASTHYRINLPSLFLGELSAVLTLCESKSIAVDINKFKHISYFKPNFLNAYGKLIDFGQASKVAIAEEDIEQFKRYMAYIANNATWGKILFLVPIVYVDLFSQIAQTHAYSNEKELCDYLHKENFNFALVLGINDAKLVDALTIFSKPTDEPNLFSGLWD
ncbi:hypothetical protein LS68_006230 [Helicobacter sp. MIT 05-5293]|uniref:hypothetical protein n=1 Tax=Helicobacter sp. MIT 05-5293 TaxID=1548149 RepID=UPI00051D715B|nr:hypothetical protein [Helicobacter sp. MIT 05-5293]TLD81058.1 hypothetical protein LS68_006230 [Helicobacter sp. MIT 05-5293]